MVSLLAEIFKKKKKRNSRKIFINLFQIPEMGKYIKVCKYQQQRTFFAKVQYKRLDI